jgi:hypothetical protein
LEEPSLAARLAEAGCAFALRHFDWKRIIAETEQLYYDAAGRGLEAPALATEAEMT